MFYYLNKTVETYKHIFYEVVDQRTKDWFLYSGPGTICIITALYLYFCMSFGPRFMENRKPFELKRVVMLYNIFQVFLSMSLFSKGVQIIASDFSFYCEPVDYSSSPTALKVAAVSWLYSFAKVTELLDTVFFVLRKKMNQVSFLHVYHHSVMAIAVWISAKFYPGGHAMLMGTMNSFVHIIMYTYYFISGLGPEYQKYIWWKKHVTVLQLTQFIIIACHNIHPFFNDCSYPKGLNLLMLCNSILFMYLFGKFYIVSYMKRAKQNEDNAKKNYITSTEKEKNN